MDGSFYPLTIRSTPGSYLIASSNLKDTKGAPTAVLNVNRVRNARWPTSREAQGNGVSVVVRGRESRLQGEGRQVSQAEGRTGETV